MRKSVILPVLGTMLVGLTSTIAASGVDGSYNCSSTSACFSASQSAPAGSSGAGFHGTAINAPGMRGNSTSSVGLLGQSASGSLMEPGVEGESTYSGSSTVSDLGGGFGLSALTGGHIPQIGALGVGLASGISGENTSSSSSMSAGVLGSDTTGTAAGVVGESETTSNNTGGVGVAGMVQPYQGNTAGVGVYGQAGSGPMFEKPTAAYGAYFSSNSSSTHGIGLGAEGYDQAALLYNSSVENAVEIADVDYLIYGQGSGAAGIFRVDNDANLYASGTISGSNIETSGDATYDQKGASGSTLTAYGTRSAAPELEDVGDAQLVNGRAIVHIDGKLADVMDRSSAYHVFLTPDGDCKGLFVAQKTPTSFVVGELQGGRSTMSFDYRIVAKPYGHARERLAVAAPLRRPPEPLALRRRSGTPVHLPTFMRPPDQVLRASVGPQRYARLIAAKRKELAAR